MQACTALPGMTPCLAVLTFAPQAARRAASGHVLLAPCDLCVNGLHSSELVLTGFWRAPMTGCCWQHECVHCAVECMCMDVSGPLAQQRSWLCQ